MNPSHKILRPLLLASQWRTRTLIVKRADCEENSWLEPYLVELRRKGQGSKEKGEWVDD